MAGTRLHLVRHGHTEALGRTLTGRSPGIGLSAQGAAEATALAATLAFCPAAAILCSPQLRTRQTADAIAAVLGLEVQTSAALDEVDFGAWAGERFVDLDGRADWQAWNTRRSLSPSPGETMLAVQARVVALVQDLCADRPDRELVLVSHADVLRSLLAYLLAVPIDLMQRIDLSPASRSVVLLSQHDVTIEAVNLPPR